MGEDRNKLIRRAYPVIMLSLLTVMALFCFVFAGGTVFDMQHRIASGMTADEYTEVWRTPDGINVAAPLYVKTGENVPLILETVLPADLPEQPMLAFPTIKQSVRAYINGELVYEWDDSADSRFGRAASNTWNFVSLGSASGGETLRLELTSPYYITSGVLTEVYIGSELNLKLAMVQRSMPEFILCTGLSLLGASLLLITMLLSRRRMAYRAARYISAFTVIAGVCIGLSMNRPQLSTVNDYTSSLIARMLFMLLPLPLVAYTKTRASVFGQKMLNVLFWTAIGNYFLTIILQLTNVADLYETMMFTHLLLVVLGVTMVVTYIHGVKMGELSLKPPEPYGLLALLIGCGFELVRFYVPGATTSGVFMLMGLTVFIISLVSTIVIEAEKSTRQRERLIREVEDGRMRLMAGQIQPHFVFNALAAIRAQISEDPEKAKRSVYSFAKHLRANIDSMANGDLISFTAEVDNVRAYTEIQELRYGDHLSVRFDLEATEFEVPPLTVQPLVENAIRHGVSPKANGGEVVVSSFETADSYVIRVEDNGVGFEPAELTGRSDVGISTGIGNVRYRLSAKLGATLKITSKPDRGTVAEIQIPKNYVPSEDYYEDNFG